MAPSKTVLARAVATLFALGLAGAVPAAAAAPAPGSAADRAASLKFLLGTWHCTRTVTVGTGKAATMSETQVVTATSPEVVHGRQTITREGLPGSSQDLYLSYNPRHAMWTLITIDAGGGTEVETSTSAALNHSSWSVVFPASGNGTSSFWKTADNGYASTSKWTSAKNGGVTTSHEACTRQ